MREQAPDNHARFVTPLYNENPSLHWTQGYHRRSPQAWRDTIAWGLQANDVFVLSAYDDYGNGSFWGIADTRGVPNSQTPRRCNEDWNPNVFDMYYNTLVTLLGKAPEASIYVGDEGKTMSFSSPVDIAYGVNGNYRWRYGHTGGIQFNNANFGGDPAPGVLKHAFTRPSIQSGGVYKLVNRKSGKGASIDGSTGANGANAIQFQLNGGSKERWTVTHVGNGDYEIKNNYTGSLLHVAGGSTSNGANVVQWLDRNLSQQRWEVVHVAGAFFKIINAKSGMVLTVQNGA